MKRICLVVPRGSNALNNNDSSHFVSEMHVFISGLGTLFMNHTIKIVAISNKLAYCMHLM